MMVSDEVAEFQHFAQAAGEAKAMNQSELKGDHEPAGAGSSARCEDVLEGDEDDASGDDGLNDRRRHAYPTEGARA